MDSLIPMHLTNCIPGERPTDAKSTVKLPKASGLSTLLVSRTFVIWPSTPEIWVSGIADC